jgi:hypothetical protein
MASIQSTFIQSPNSIDIYSWPQNTADSHSCGPNIINIHSWPQYCQYCRHSFMTPIQSTFIHGPNTIDIHSWPQYNRHSFMALIKSTFIHGPNTIDIHSWSQYNRHSFMAPILSTFIHDPNTIDIHSWLARIHVNKCRNFNNCMGAFLFYADAFTMKQMSKRIEGDSQQGECYSLNLSAFGSVWKLMKAGDGGGGEAVGTGVLTAYVW